MAHFIEDQPRVPEPALIRGAVLAVTALLAVVFKLNVDVSWLDNALTVYGILTPVIAGYLIRRKVTPVVVAEARVKAALLTEPPV